MDKPDDVFRIDVVDAQCVPAGTDKTLLESLEQHGIDVHYHCREGFCGACRTKLLAGNVRYTTDPLAYIDDDEILPCCCIPLTHLKVTVPR
ncbi:class I ribonucleotide reductase maintenance protein YfaE [Salinimonas sediminis]|uniref:2Fe-2S ferredoxin-like protein n=1 Tax=Salinimonas sediminis TaxID=2303538 RepID=A0A346NMN3_9ALTE|nr:class I ribonucleotide reductase maintenance protein YfaE [Salinimonas sediminis]AXR06790.1 2Fe-2S ferredoxin-like protein [Salinimonas sediminis]